MSLLVGGAQPFGVILLEDLRLLRADMQQIFATMVVQDHVAPGSFASEWWPGGGLWDDASGVYGGILEGTSLAWGPYDQAGPGGSSRYGFVGVTRDALGTPAGNCVVKLFRTADDRLIDRTTSDPLGNFLLNTPYYPDQHYIVCHKTDGPVISGASVNTLIGT